MPPKQRSRSMGAASAPRLTSGNASSAAKKRKSKRRSELLTSPAKRVEVKASESVKKTKEKTAKVRREAVCPTPPPAKVKVKRKLNLSVLDVDTTEDIKGDAEDSKRSKDAAAASRTESVAKGVFVFKGSPGSSGRVRRDNPGRSEYHAAAIANADESFARLRSDMFADVVDAVVGFVERNKRAAESVSSLIPVCALLTGVNLPDHEDVFEILAGEMSGRGAMPHVARVRSAQLSSSASGSGLLQLVQSVVRQLLKAKEDSSADEREVELKRAKMTLPTLDAWYNNQYPKGGGNGKKSRISSRPPLVVIAEDFEGFGAVVMQDFILNLAEYHRAGLPFVLILGVATTASVIHRALPHPVSKLLSIEKFSGQKSTELLTRLVEDVTLDPWSEAVSFRLGGRALDTLLEIFTYNDFAVKRFLAGYKFCLFEHFRRSPLPSLLCTQETKSGRRRGRIHKLLTEDQLDRCRALKTFRRHVEADPAARAALLSDSDAFRSFLADSLDRLDVAADRFGVFVACLHAVAKDLPGAPFGKHLHSVYRVCMMSGDATETHEYRETFTKAGLRSTTALELRNRLAAIVHSLETAAARHPDDVVIRGHLSSCGARLTRLDLFIDDPEGFEKEAAAPGGTTTKKKVEAPSSSSSSPSGSKGATPKLSMRKLQENLKRQLQQQQQQKQQNSPAAASKGSPFDSLRREILAHLHSDIFKDRRMSTPPTQLPFAEVKYFDSASSVRRHLMAAPRALIQTALEDPNAYLQSADLSSSSQLGSINAALPDLSVAYKLQGECGRLVNLYDWMQSWISIAPGEDGPDGPDKVKDSKVKEKSAGEAELRQQARFTQSVSSLQFLGFVRASKRKTDHMQRLTW